MFSQVRKTSHCKNTLYKFKVRTKTFNPIKISFTNQSINFLHKCSLSTTVTHLNFQEIPSMSDSPLKHVKVTSRHSCNPVLVSEMDHIFDYVAY